MKYAIIAVALLVAACGTTQDKTDQIPKIRLPAAPDSEKVDCAKLSDADVEKCRADMDSRPICRAALKNCARLQNLQGYNKTLRDSMEGM